MIQDINGNEITIGSYVRYINTGTKGQVVNIRIDGDDVWVVLDNDLMYRPNLLEVLYSVNIGIQPRKNTRLNLKSFSPTCS